MGRIRKALLTALIVGVGGFAVGATTFSAFSASTSNANNAFSAGTVVMTDNDGGSTALVSLSGARPGDSSSGCIKATYTGTLDSSVKLYAALTGTLAPYLTLKVTRGTQTTGTFPACGNFAADATDYNGNGAGVIYQGLLSAYPADYAGGILDPKTATPETWTTNEDHVYRFEVTLADNNATQGLTGGATFHWEARNL